MPKPIGCYLITWYRFPELGATRRVERRQDPLGDCHQRSSNDGRARPGRIGRRP